MKTLLWKRLASAKPYDFKDDTELGHWTDGAWMRAALAAYAQKAATNNGDFFDVPTSHWAYDTVKWAVDRGITNGTSATSFSPNSTCTKAQILTFLYRALK